MTEVIATRYFWWEGEPDHQALVSLGKPEKAPDGAGEFYCPLQTVGLGEDDFNTAIFGVDAFQAIELALKFIGWRMADINEKNGGRLRWEFGDNGHLPKEWARRES